MKRLKQILAVVLSVMTIFTMGTLVMGTTTIPSASDKGNITVSNLKAGDTVSVYQFVKANYNEYGFVKYTAINNYVKNPVQPTADEVITMASSTSSMTKQAEGKVAAGKTEVTISNLPVGYYLVTVNSASGTVYSPMIAGVYYSKSATDNTLTNGAIDSKSDFTIKGQKCWAKSSTPKLEKTILNASSKNNKGDDIAIGDKVTFDITATIPSYSKDYKKATYKIVDTMSGGLDFVKDSLKCYVVNGNDKQTANATTSVVGRKIEVVLDSDFILAHAGQKIEVMYEAQLNDNAGINFGANTNKAYLEYTNNPKCNSTAKTNEDIVYVYTFGIDSKLFGCSAEKWNKTTKELIKVGEGDYQWIEKEKNSGIYTTSTALEGATFQLTNVKTKKTYKAISDKNGYLQFKGLDAGEYVLQEINPPAGYALNDTKHKVVISAQYNQDGTLKTYSIAIDDKATSTYTATYDKGIVKEISYSTDNNSRISESTILKNVKMALLPATGGMGTGIFAASGFMCVMAGVGTLLVSKLKKRVNE